MERWLPPDNMTAKMLDFDLIRRLPDGKTTRSGDTASMGAVKQALSLRGAE